MADTSANAPIRNALVAAVGAAAAAMCIQLTGGSEGLKNDPYADRVGNVEVPTVCYGQTGVKMRHYSTLECQQMLGGSLAVFADGVKRRVPGFDDLTDGQKVAIIDYSYNRGLGNLDKPSGPNDPPSVLALYRARSFPAACEAFGAWGVVKRGGAWVDCSKRENQCYGIYVRRKREQAICKGGNG